jgi:hypothetical protein
MEPRKNLKGAGAAFLGVGAAFFAISATGQPAFMGVGAAFLVLGIVFLARARKDG